MRLRYYLIIEDSNLTSEMRNNAYLAKTTVDGSKHTLEIVLPTYQSEIPSVFDDFTLLSKDEWQNELYENIEDWETDTDFINAVNNR